MSIVRFNDTSDVYVYNNDRGIICCGCILGPDFFTRSGPEMLAHLVAHKEAGHHVPDRAIDSFLNGDWKHQ